MDVTFVSGVRVAITGMECCRGRISVSVADFHSCNAVFEPAIRPAWTFRQYLSWDCPRCFIVGGVVAEKPALALRHDTKKSGDHGTEERLMN